LRVPLLGAGGVSGHAAAAGGLERAWRSGRAGTVGSPGAILHGSLPWVAEQIIRDRG
jgi:hypothetical protein